MSMFAAAGMHSLAALSGTKVRCLLAWASLNPQMKIEPLLTRDLHEPLSIIACGASTPSIAADNVMRYGEVSCKIG